MEKLVAVSELFEISLDELVVDKVPVHVGENTTKSEIVSELKEKVLTDENKQKAIFLEPDCREGVRAYERTM